MDLSNIRVVLVSPLYSANVGSVCRAMKNMGLTHLAIAARQTELDMDDARKMACHATDVLENRKEYATTAAAVADCGLVAGTTARGGLYRAHTKTAREWAPHLAQAAQSNRVALLFGPEDNGLSNEELALCTQIIRVPTAGEYSSLNLSQAVMVCCYELFMATNQFDLPPEPAEEAPSVMRERMFMRWREALLAMRFAHEQKVDHIMMGLRRILSRGSLTTADVRILIGMARQSLWCAHQMPPKVDTRRRFARPSKAPAHSIDIVHDKAHDKVR